MFRDNKDNMNDLNSDWFIFSTFMLQLVRR